MASTRWSAALLVLLGGCASLSSAQGDGTWQRLPLVRADGQAEKVKTVLAAHRATVFVFWATGCPCVRRYQGRVDRLRAEWAARDVGFVGIDSNADDSVADIARVRAERGVELPVLQDVGGRLARALDARTTPTVVLVRRDGQVLYRGWLDNERQPGESGREPWLEQALAGFDASTSFAAASPTWGCAITRSLRAVPQCHVPPEEAQASTATEGVTP